MSNSTAGGVLFPSDNAKMMSLFEVFFNNHLNESTISDESDEVVFFIPMIPKNHFDKHKKTGTSFDMSAQFKTPNKEPNPIYMFLPIGLYSYKFLA